MVETKSLKGTGENSALSPYLIILLTIVILASPGATSAITQGILCGDSNSDNLVNIGDVVWILNFVFKGGPPPEPLCGGDVNGDGGVNVGDAVYLINWIFRGGPQPVCMANGVLINHTECKTFWKGNSAPPDQDCIQYQYDGEGLLSLQHINAGFNCCPGEIVTDVIIEGNTITIVETETEPMCYCLCLFDLDVEIYFLPPGEYTIHVVEPYRAENDEPMEFTVDLSTSTSGNHCLTRDYYPWGETSGAAGNLVGHTACKTWEKGTDDPVTPPDQDCIDYQYDGENTLLIKHVNACFNCCPTQLLAQFDFSENTVTITESENLDNGGCDCLCLFDVDYEITGIYPGEYTFLVSGMYLQGEGQEIEFTIDLNANPSGTICVTRNYYPWGLQ